MPIADLVLDSGPAMGASPVWCAQEQALYWVDIQSRHLHSWALEDHTLSSWRTSEALNCVAPSRSGSWIVGAEADVLEMTPQADGQLHSKWLAKGNLKDTGLRFNHGRCDRQGRFLLSALSNNTSIDAPAGSVYSYQQNGAESAGGKGQLAKLLEGFKTPSGMAFSPDGRTLYMADSHPTVKMIWAYDYDPETGTPTRRKVFVDMHLIGGRPEGAAVDADGCYWICGSDTGRVHRFTPDGRLDRSIAVPVKQPRMCTFGGARLETLFVTSVRPTGIDLTDQPLAGGLFALATGVCGIPEPTFSPITTS